MVQNHKYLQKLRWFPKDAQLEEDQSAYPWPLDKPFSDIVREFLGNPDAYTVLDAISELIQAERGRHDWRVSRKCIVLATALLMTMEYDMLDQVLTLLKEDYGLDTGKYEVCHHPSLAVE